MRVKRIAPGHVCWRALVLTAIAMAAFGAAPRSAGAADERFNLDVDGVKVSLRSDPKNRNRFWYSREEFRIARTEANGRSRLAFALEVPPGQPEDRAPTDVVCRLSIQNSLPATFLTRIKQVLADTGRVIPDPFEPANSWKMVEAAAEEDEVNKVSFEQLTDQPVGLNPGRENRRTSGPIPVSFKLSVEEAAVLIESLRERRRSYVGAVELKSGRVAPLTLAIDFDPAEVPVTVELVDHNGRPAVRFSNPTEYPVSVESFAYFDKDTKRTSRRALVRPITLPPFSRDKDQAPSSIVDVEGHPTDVREVRWQVSYDFESALTEYAHNLAPRTSLTVTAAVDLRDPIARALVREFRGFEVECRSEDELGLTATASIPFDPADTKGNDLVEKTGVLHLVTKPRSLLFRISGDVQGLGPERLFTNWKRSDQTQLAGGRTTLAVDRELDLALLHADLSTLGGVRAVGSSHLVIVGAPGEATGVLFPSRIATKELHVTHAPGRLAAQFDLIPRIEEQDLQRALRDKAGLGVLDVVSPVLQSATVTIHAGDVVLLGKREVRADGAGHVRVRLAADGPDADSAAALLAKHPEQVVILFEATWQYRGKTVKTRGVTRLRPE